MIVNHARKRHLCEVCTRWIKKGQFYFRVPKDGEAICLPCKRGLEKRELSRVR